MYSGSFFVLVVVMFVMLGVVFVVFMVMVKVVCFVVIGGGNWEGFGVVRVRVYLVFGFG